MIAEEEYIVKILESVAKKLNIDNWSYVKRNTNGNIMNFMGDLISVYFLEEKSRKEIGLIIKKAPFIPQFENTIDLVFKNEVSVYSKLMPIFRSLNTDVNLEELYPECYFADSRERVLVLQDMTWNGYEQYRKGEYLDCQHMMLSLTTCAKFHSLSFVLFDRKIEFPQRNIFHLYCENYPNKLTMHIPYILKRNLPVFKNRYYEGYLLKLHENFMKNLNDCSSKTKRLVYGHGDFWKENILFKYSNQIPTAACLVDFQLTRLLSPAQDVLFLIMSGTESIIRRNNFKHFLSTYYSSLHGTLLTNGVDAATVYSEEDFNNDLKVIFPFCFTLTVCSSVLWLGLEDINSLTLKKEKVSEKKDEFLEKKLIGIVDDLILDFIILGYISL